MPVAVNQVAIVPHKIKIPLLYLPVMLALRCDRGAHMHMLLHVPGILAVLSPYRLLFDLLHTFAITFTLLFSCHYYLLASDFSYMGTLITVP